MEETGKKVLFLTILLAQVCLVYLAKKANYVEKISEHKEWKKLVRTRNNVLGIFASSDKDLKNEMKLFQEVAEKMKGLATLATVNCGEEKKLCKKLRTTPSKGLQLKHFKDGEFNKVYDRRMLAKSMEKFLQNPSADVPWEEEEGAESVAHLDDQGSLNKLVQKGKPVLVMFYAPWCGHCKRMKPDYVQAASELKDKMTLAGMDVDKQENMGVRMMYNITGFPTIVYFDGGKKKFNYHGGNTKDDIMKWAEDPQPPQEKAPEPEWSDEESEVAHLTDDDFAEYMETHPSVLVMFYAPWCGHCKKMKPEYTEAAAKLKTDGFSGVIAAVDATKSKALGEKFEVKGYPTVKYFKDGEVQFDVNKRTTDDIVEFMKDPKEPPPPPPPEPEWSETESDVSHLTDENFKNFLKKKKHTLVMFYAPWCGHCKKAKPEYMQAAEKLKDNPKVAFAAMDCTKSTAVCKANEVTGYPTFKYFNYGKNEQKYTGGREEADFVKFMSDPQNPLAAAPSTPEAPAVWWADARANQYLNHLTYRTFSDFIIQHDKVLVVFYANSCKHSQKMKPDFALAAGSLHDFNNEIGYLATVDCAVETQLQTQYEVKEYPTFKYFRDGEFLFNYEGARTAEDILKFMNSPRPPPPKIPDGNWADVESNVQHLTDKNFDSFITEKPYTLVMFYTSWCGHCKTAKPHYQEAANWLKSDKNKYMAALNCEEYKPLCKEQEIKGYPTMKLYYHGEEIESYSGQRERDALYEYMKNPPQHKKKQEL